MRRIVSFFVRQNLFGDLLTVSVIGIGIVTLFLIRREVFPNVQFDVVTMTTLFPGAAPEEVEKLITNPLEQDMKEVDGIKRIQSVSIENRSGIVVYVDPDQTSGKEAREDIQDVVDRFTDLPTGAEDPQVVELESKMSPIIEVSISGDIPEVEMRGYAKRLEKELELLSGVARVVHRGLRDLEIRVEVSQAKLSAYRLSLEDLVASLKSQNVSIPGGSIEPKAGTKGAERVVRTSGEFKTLQDVENTVVRANDLGQTIKIGQVARVFYALERSAVINRTNGMPALSLTVLQKENSDAINVVQRVKARIEELKPQLSSQLKFDYINDLSYYIQRRLNILTGNLTIGLALVLLLLPLMIPMRFAVLIALGEPFAFLGALILLHNAGYSINLISMIGLIIVSGILVDDSIVVTENAVRLIEDEGMDPKEAAITGTMQIIPPVTASLMTTSMAFLPMAFMSGIFGKFIVQIPVAVLACLAVSMFETFFILPAHIAHWIKPRAKPNPENSKKRNLLFRMTEASQGYWEKKIIPFYVRWLKFTLQNRYKLAVFMILLFFGSILLAVKGMRFILFPPEGIEVFFIRAEAPVGSSIDQTSESIRKIEALVQKLPQNELDYYTTSIGIPQQDPNDPFTQRGGNLAQVQVFLTPETSRQRTAAEIIESLRKEIGEPKEYKVTYNRVNPGPPQGKPVSLGIRSKEYADILPAVQKMKAILAEMPGVTDIEDSYVLGKEELNVKVNSAEAAAAGLSVASIGNSVRASFEGLVATTVRELDEEIDVRVSLPEGERGDSESLQEILIPNQMGNLIPLTRVAQITKSQNLSSYEHEHYERQIKVTAEVDTKVTTAVEVNGKVRAALADFKKQFPKVDVGFGGEDEDTQESLQSLGRAFAVALLSIFLILVLTFKSLLLPMITLLTVPLGIIAVIWAFFVHGIPMSFMGMLGVIALSGVIVNNAIIFVDFVNQARENGASRYDSIIDAGRIRVRPIFLTTVTTVIGILPTAYGIGGVDKFVVPIAMALGWGLFFGSILTAFVFPSALAILDDVSGFVERRFPRMSSIYK